MTVGGRRTVLSPHPTLSLREREQPPQARVLRILDWQTPSRTWPEDGGGFSLSPGERDGVRGKKIWRIQRSHECLVVAIIPSSATPQLTQARAFSLLESFPDEKSGIRAGTVATPSLAPRLT